MSNQPEGSPQPASEPLQFDKAEFSQGQALTCAVCKAPIPGDYFQVNGQTVCTNCRAQLDTHLSGSKLGRLSRATVAGTLAGIAGFLIYWAIRASTGYEFGLVAILVGWMVGVAVRWGAQNRGGWVYQLMAVVLTYFSIASNYCPDVLRGMRQGRAEEQAALSSGTETNTVASAVTNQPAGKEENGGPGEEVPLWFALPFAFAISLAVPFLMGAENIIGILIIVFGLIQAWRLNKPLNISGPFSVTGNPPAAAS